MDSVLNHSSADYAESVIDAVEILVDRYISQAQFDKTIQATILSCTSSTKGEYQCKYQDSKFYAYTSPDTTYTADTLVYILVPRNDWSETKTILGTVDKLGVDYISNISKKEYYDPIGTNIVENSTLEVSMTTWDDDSDVILYDYANNINTIGLNIDKVNDYVKNAEYLKIKGDFFTKIEDQTLGYFGIRIKVAIPDSEEVRVYELRSTDMIGSPNHLGTVNLNNQRVYVSQQKIVSLDSELHFDKILRIEAFVDNYTQATGHDPDVFIKNFEFVAQRRLTEAEMAGGTLSIDTIGGSIFYKTGNVIKPSLIELKGVVRIDGIPTDNSDIKYYWFVQDSRSYSGSPLERELLCQLSSIDTQGWACLNTYSEEGSRRLWNAAGNTYDLTPDVVIAKKVTYKCIALYDDMVMEKEVTIENRGAKYDISIESENGTDFFKDQGETTLTCTATPIGITPPGEFSYYWSSYGSNGVFNTYGDWTNISDTIPAISIIKFTRFICTVYIGATFIGSAEIILYNKDTTATGTYQLNILNGDQTFLYDEDGYSPTSDKQDQKQYIKTLEVAFYDNLAKRIDNETVLQTSTIKWYVPKEDTLLIVDSQIPHYDGEGENDGYIIYEQTPTLSFSIQEIYDVYCLNNQIKLTIEYNGNVYMAYTSLVFNKQGGLGTNGTIYSCKIVPRTNDAFNETRIIIREELNGTHNFNFVPINTATPFKVNIYRNGQQIFSDYQNGNTSDGIPITLKWSVCGKASNACYTISENGTFTYLSFPTNPQQPFDNILKVEVEIQSQDARNIFCFCPLTFIKILNPAHNAHKIELARHHGMFTGFTQVQYNADGNHPVYDWNEDFAPKVYVTNSGEDVTHNYTITRSLYGDDIRYVDPQHEAISELRPADHYNGLDVNNAVVFTCANNFILYCPVVFYYNRFGLAALNAWDGTKIEIDEENGRYIYAPQVGAGIKDRNNTFTGVMIGKCSLSNHDPELGLMAYGQSVRTVFINAKTGQAEFGAGKGKIYISPDPENDNSCIYGGGYDVNPTTGMIINLSEPSIAWGNGNFKVNSQGLIEAINMNLKRNSTDTQPYYSINEYGLLLDVGSSGTYDPVRPPGEIVSGSPLHKVLIYDSDMNKEDSQVNAGYKTNARAEFGKDGIILQSTMGSFLYIKDEYDHSSNGQNTTLSSANALYLRSGMLNNVPDPGPRDDTGENTTVEASTTVKAAFNANIWAGHGLSLRVTGPHDRDNPQENQVWPPAYLDSHYGYMKLETQYGWLYMSSKAGGKDNTPGIGINAYTWEYRQANRGESEDDPYGVGGLDKGTPFPGRDYKVYINGNEVLDVGNAAEATGGDLGGACYVSEFGNLRPYLDNLVSLGSYYEEGDGIAAWRHVVTYDTIQVSDRREKDDIQDMDKRYVDFIMNLRPKKYKYFKTRENVYRTGFIAQEVEDDLNEVGLNNEDFGGLKKQPILMEGKVVDYGYGLNYDDFVAALVLTVQDLQKQINDLKGELKNGTRNAEK